MKGQNPYSRFRVLARVIVLLLMLSVASVASAQQRNKKMPVNMPPGTTNYYEQNIRAFFRTDDWHDGKLLLDTAIVKFPQESAFHELMGRYLVHQAMNETKNGGKNAKANYDKARFHLIKAINIDEKNVRARQLMLQVETDTKHYSTAIVYCNELLEENPYNETLWRKKIDLYRHLGNNVEADRLLERLRSIYPDNEQLAKDMKYRTEQKAVQQKRSGDRIGYEASLRELIKLDPYNRDNYLALTNILYSSGRLAEAAEMAGQGAAMSPNSMELIKRKASILCEMNRPQEAIEYVKSQQKLHNGPQLQQLLSSLQVDAARAAQLNDVYIAYAKVFESQRSQEALDFLTNTSIQRGYLDDALMYLAEQRRRKGDTAALLFKEYIVNRRLGNKQKANSLLERLHVMDPNNDEVENDLAENRLTKAAELMVTDQYAEAIPLLEFIAMTKADKEIKQSAAQRLYNCFLQTKQYAKAERALTDLQQTYGVEAFVPQKAMLYALWGRTQTALDLLANEYNATPEADADYRMRLSATYEELAVPYIKGLISAGMLYHADSVLKRAIDVCPASTDILHQCITVAQMQNDRETVMRCVVRGRRMFPDDPYYVIKEAQVQSSYGQYREALNTLKPLLDVYVADSTIIGAYAENSELLAHHYLKLKQPEEAMAVVDSALVFAPMNMQLLYTKGEIFEYLKDWPNAYAYYKLYKPGYDELSAYNRHMEEVLNHAYSNALSFEYQQARLGSTDAITGNAYLSYTRKCRLNDYTFAMAYAGRDGSGDNKDTELTQGGTGIQLSAAWQHRFSERFTAQILGAWASRYFPKWTVSLSAAYDLPHDWQLSARASYRNVRSFRGIYDKVEVLKDIDSEGNPVYVKEFSRVGWESNRKSLWLLGLGLTKTMGQFTLAGGVDGFLLGRNLYVNGNAKMQFFPLEGNRSNFFATAGLGTAPESSLIDRSLPVGFNNLNTFVGMGGYYFLNRYIGFGLAGTWYTMLNQSERLTTSIVETEPDIRKDYQNYFYLHANVIISF